MGRIFHHYPPSEALSLRDPLSALRASAFRFSQILTDIGLMSRPPEPANTPAYCAGIFPNQVRRAVSAQFMDASKIAIAKLCLDPLPVFSAGSP